MLNKLNTWKGYCPNEDAVLSLNVDLCDYSYMLRGAFGEKDLKNHASLIDVLILEYPELLMNEDPVTSPKQNDFI